jgi:hypothetical protein
MTTKDGIAPADQGTTCDCSKAQIPESGEIASEIDLGRWKPQSDETYAVVVFAIAYRSSTDNEMTATAQLGSQQVCHHQRGKLTPHLTVPNDEFQHPRTENAF